MTSEGHTAESAHAVLSTGGTASDIKTVQKMALSECLAVEKICAEEKGRGRQQSCAGTYDEVLKKMKDQLESESDQQTLITTLCASLGFSRPPHASENVVRDRRKLPPCLRLRPVRKSRDWS